MAAVAIAGLTYTYIAGDAPADPALRDVSLTLKAGEVVALMGQTGAGKSTLLQFCDGLLLPAGPGIVRVLGFDTGERGLRLRPLRLRVGLLLQRAESQLIEAFVGDDVAFGPRQLGLPRDEVRERVRVAMEALGLDFDAFKDRRTLGLSGGEAKRVALAGLLALRPEVYLLDEPTAGLDPETRVALLTLIRDLSRQGAAVLIASTSIEDVPGVVDRVVVMDHGAIAGEIAGAQLWRHADFLRRYALDLPETGLVVEALRHRWPLEPRSLTPEDVATEICKTSLTCDT